MFSQLLHIKLLFKRLGIILLLYSILRILFCFLNKDMFPVITYEVFFKSLFYGMRFDISAIIYSNLLFILLHIVPHPYHRKNWYQKITKTVFYIFNVFALFIASADLIYYRFTLKRITDDVFGIAQDFFNLLPQFIKDFWYVLLIFLLLLLFIEYLYRKTYVKNINVKNNYWIQSIILIFSFFIFLIGARGGLQLIPISPITATKYTEVSLVPLFTNTPFTFMKSLEHQGLKEKHFFETKEVKKLYQIYYNKKSGLPKKNDNIVLIIMESFSNEYIGALNGGSGYTPFLDSLMQKSLTFNNFFANGKNSNKGLVAITAGIPDLMDNPYITSVYQDNRITGLGTLLKRVGYNTYFFHGGKNGTFGFDYFTKAAGFDKYYGMDEYDNNETDFDGNWGIYDEEFFQFFAEKLNNIEQPFCAIFFSLTSHHPCKIPERYEGVFEDGSLPIHKTIRYSDYALKRFFSTASKQSWFDNTLFIITADHTSQLKSIKYNNRVGSYAIPLVLFKKGSHLKGETDIIAHQIDILPTILDYLNYRGKYVAFGKSIFDTSDTKYAFQYLNGIYQIIDDAHILQFDGEQSIGLYNYHQDYLLKYNLLDSLPEKWQYMEKHLKAVIQTYNNSLIHNKLVIE